jgi:UDP-N-acetylmuramoylalanine--D-glutamate ligase
MRASLSAGSIGRRPFIPMKPPLPAGPYLIVGLARSGLAAGLTLRSMGEEVVGVDGGASAGVQALADAGARVLLGEDGLAQLERVNAVVKSPGVPAHAPAIAAARARGLTVLGELELAWRLLPSEFIAVTGTNGKTTTVELIGHIHRTAGLPVEVAGNVGVALSGLVGRVSEQATIVCEASSFQLEDTLAFAPEAAVLLNVTPDHLDRHATIEAYRAAKTQIFARQDAGDLAVLPRELDGAGISGAARRVHFDDARYAPFAGELRLPGGHNGENAMAAAAVCLERGLDPDAVRAGLRSFAGVPHRLEEVARRDGVLYVNDSKATNVQSTLVALRAFPDRPIHLILGGQGKGQDFAPLRAAVRRSCRAVYLIGEDAPLIAAALQDASASSDAAARGNLPASADAAARARDTAPVRECGTLEQAVATATGAAQSGEVVLLSPACASFDQFTDFEARGERFRELVR